MCDAEDPYGIPRIYENCWRGVLPVIRVAVGIAMEYNGPSRSLGWPAEVR